MPWKTQDLMSIREQFVELASLEGANKRELCRRFGISPTVAYKWLKRFRQEGVEGLRNRSRRPRRTPKRVGPEVEQAVLALRHQHPAWGARKLRRCLEVDGFAPLPARSTVNDILRRHGLLVNPRPQRDLQRFERSQPNELWQIDFKGYFSTAEGSCHPLTTLDDHSRYCLGIFACAREDGATVRSHLEGLFSTYGLPRAILCDNGGPWGSPNSRCPVSSLGLWFWRLGIDVLHGRPWHPQTQGKLERFHRTLKSEVLNRPFWTSRQQCQRHFDRWRPLYNHKRPHEALGDNPPSSRYRPSQRSLPDSLPEVEYDHGVTTRRVSRSGALSFQNRFYFVGRAFTGHRIGFVPTEEDQVYDVYFGWKKLGTIHHRPTKTRKTNTSSVWSK